MASSQHAEFLDVTTGPNPPLVTIATMRTFVQLKNAGGHYKEGAGSLTFVEKYFARPQQDRTSRVDQVRLDLGAPR